MNRRHAERGVLVTVATFREPFEAHMFRSRLEVEGIPAMVAHENHVGMNWLWSTGLGGAKVQVPGSWADEARAVERRCRDGDFTAELKSELGDLDDRLCPACGSNRYWKRRPIVQAVFCIVLMFGFGKPIPPWSWVRFCENCGAKWRR
jgi:hypothetical protein